MGPAGRFAELRKGYDRHLAAVKLCQSIGADKPVDIWSIADINALTELCAWKDNTALECPLSLAADKKPRLALEMLAAGVDPRRAPIGGGSLLLAAAFRSTDNEERLALFSRLLELGADPAEPVVWRLTSGRLYSHSLLAHLVRYGQAKFIELLRDRPDFDWRIWPVGPEGAEPVTAADYARSLGRAELAGQLEGWSRWNVPRRAWVAAVLRPPPLSK